MKRPLTWMQTEMLIRARRMEILVPTGATMIVPASGIVSAPDDAPRSVYFEGGLYGATNVVDYDDRLRIAAGRAAVRYPTIAVVRYEAAAYRRVGVYDAAAWTILELDDEAVAPWLGGQQVYAASKIGINGRLPFDRLCAFAALIPEEAGGHPTELLRYPPSADTLAEVEEMVESLKRLRGIYEAISGSQHASQVEDAIEFAGMAYRRHLRTGM